MNIPPPLGFNSHGDRIHVSPPESPGYVLPHLTGNFEGKPTIHVPYVGQTTLPMFEKGGQSLGTVASLHERFPSIFRNSGLKF
ncbi:MAG TPA: hypothetical protein VMP11_10700 [Verrucomicrobiae bacterium]|nr:hypothetical protein [Verrucomicrobiae bacterium]